MKRNLIFLAVIIFVVTFSSCKTSRVHNITQAQARIVDTDFGVITAPIIGELDDVSCKRIVDSVEFYIGGFKNAERDILPYLDEYKRYTIANFCTRNGYDIIINPLFQVSTNEDGNMLKVVVTGFPARYKNFRQATSTDEWMLMFLSKEYMNDNRMLDVIKLIFSGKSNDDFKNNNNYKK